MKCKPKDGQIFKKLDGRLLAKDGEELPDDTYYQRAIVAGDIKLIETNGEKPKQIKNKE